MATFDMQIPRMLLFSQWRVLCLLDTVAKVKKDSGDKWNCFDMRPEL